MELYSLFLVQFTLDLAICFSPLRPRKITYALLCDFIFGAGGWNKLAPPLNISSSGPMRWSLHLVPPSKEGKTLGDGRDGRKPRLKVTLPSYARAKISHKNGNTSLGVLFKFSIAITRRAVGRTTELELVYSIISNFIFFIFFLDFTNRSQSKQPSSNQKIWAPQRDGAINLSEGGWRGF